MKINKRGPIGKNMAEVDIALAEMFGVDRIIEKYQRTLLLTAREDQLTKEFKTFNNRMALQYKKVAKDRKARNEETESVAKVLNSFVDICHAATVEKMIKMMKSHECNIAIVTKTNKLGRQYYCVDLYGQPADPSEKPYKIMTLHQCKTYEEAVEKAEKIK